MVTTWPDKKVPLPLNLLLKNKNAPFTGKEKAEIVRRVCSGEYAPDNKHYAAGKRAAYEVGQVYAEKHAHYYNHRIKNWRFLLKKNNGVMGCCSRAAYQADTLAVDVDDYVEAQFWYFNELFSKAPRYQDLATTNAVLRLKQWKSKGLEKSSTVNKAVTLIDTRKTLSSVELEYEERILFHMIRGWGSEEKVWSLFGDSDEVFSELFKKTRPIWCELYMGK